MKDLVAAAKAFKMPLSLAARCFTALGPLGLLGPVLDPFFPPESPSGRVSKPLQFLVTQSIMGFNVRAKQRSEHPRSRFMRAYQPSILGVTKLAVKSENELLKHGGNIWG